MSRTWSVGGGPALVAQRTLCSQFCTARYEPRLNPQVKIGFGNYFGNFCSPGLASMRTSMALDVASWDEEVLAKAWVEVHPAMLPRPWLCPALLSMPVLLLIKSNWKKS